MKSFFYVSGRRGLNYSGNFVDNRTKWVKFTQEEVLRGKPKFANDFGVFIDSSKFKWV